MALPISPPPLHRLPGHQTPPRRRATAALPYTEADTRRVPLRILLCYSQHMALSDEQLLDALSRTPFIDSAELALILGEPHATVHRTLADLLAEGIVGRVSHGIAHLPSSQRYHLTARGIGEAAWVLGFATPSDFVRAYPASREWLTLLIRRMDAVASIYRLAASLSPGIDGLRSRVAFHPRGRFDATLTLHDGRSFGVVRQGLALRRRSLYDRLRAIAEYDYTRRPGTVLILVPSVWEERLTTRFCEERNIRDCYVAVESRDALARRDLRLWCSTSWVIGSRLFSLKGGISPLNWFEYRFRYFNLERLPSSGGIFPLNWLLLRFRLVTWPVESVFTPNHWSSGASLSQPPFCVQFGPSVAL